MLGLAVAASIMSAQYSSTQPVRCGGLATHLLPRVWCAGNHMTQGAIDLVQAQLKPPPFPSLPLLQHVSSSLPELISTDEITRPPQHKPITKYTWQDEGDFIGITIHKDAITSATAVYVQQIQCSTGPSHLQCTIQETAKDGVVTQHVLRIAHLHAPVQPQVWIMAQQVLMTACTPLTKHVTTTIP